MNILLIVFLSCNLFAMDRIKGMQTSSDSKTTMLVHINETSGTEIKDNGIYSYSGNTFGSVLFSKGLYGNCFEGDGTTAYITMTTDSNAAAGTSDFTCNIWALFISTSSANYTFFSVYRGGLKNYVMLVWDANGNIASRLWFDESQYPDDIGITFISSSYTPQLNHWDMYSLVWDSSKQTETIYINGDYFASDVGSTCIAMNDYGTYYIGLEASSNNRWFNGKLEEFTKFNRALSQAELKYLWESGRSGI